MTRVAITGWALASPFGNDPDAFWQGICHGPTPASTWPSVPGYPQLACNAALLPPDCRPRLTATLPHPNLALAADLGRRALVSAGLERAPAGLGIALGSLWGDGDYLAKPRIPAPTNWLPTLAGELGLGGPVLGVSVACASGNIAMAWAYDRIRSGEVPCMLAGGLDMVSPTAAGTYAFLGTFTEDLPRPFDVDRDGFLFGEGGAVFLMEPLDQARAAGRRVLAEIVGVGGGHDASHPTRPPDDGRGFANAMRRASGDAGLRPADIGYVNAHSPGTQANDQAEAAAIHDVYGPNGVPVSSTKGAIGHAQGGANSLEAAACILALRHQAIPPTMNLVNPDPALAPIDLVMGAPRPAELAHVLSVASSMGGATSALVFARGDAWA